MRAEEEEDASVAADFNLKNPRLPEAGYKAKLVQYIADAGAHSPRQGEIFWGRNLQKGGY